MLGMVEYIEPQWSDFAARKVADIRAAGYPLTAMRVRFPRLVPVILADFPDMHFLCRNPGEGEDVGDVINGYHQWQPTLDRYAECVIAYQPANEPNNNSFRDPWHWVASVREFIEGIPHPLCSPGLVRYTRRQDWQDALDTLPWDFIGRHVYWQHDGYEAALADLIDSYDGLRPIIVSEINAGDARPEYAPTLDERAEQTRQAFAALAERPTVYAACLFSLTSWQNWGYTYDPETISRILAAGGDDVVQVRRPTIKFPQKKKEQPMSDELQYGPGVEAFVQEHPEIGPVVANETWITPDFSLTECENGLLFYSKWTNRVQPVPFELPASGK